MSRSPIPGKGRTLRRGLVVLAVAALPFTMAVSCDDEGAVEPGIEEEQPLDDDGDDGVGDDGGDDGVGDDDSDDGGTGDDDSDDG